MAGRAGGIVISRRRPRPSTPGRPRDGPELISPASHRSGPPDPQPTTATHDDAAANRPGARMSRCASSDLSGVVHLLTDPAAMEFPELLQL